MAANPITISLGIAAVAARLLWVAKIGSDGSFASV
jgi:hypothetical protein